MIVMKQILGMVMEEAIMNVGPLEVKNYQYVGEPHIFIK